MMTVQTITLFDLPTVLLRVICAQLVPSSLQLSDPASKWRPIVRFALAYQAAHDVLGDILREQIASAASRLRPLEKNMRTCWLSLLASIRSQWTGSWQRIRALRGGVCLPTASATPCHSVPGCSGSSLCPMGDGKLLLYGGRSVSGQTLGKTYIAHVGIGLARWEELHCKVQPGARCYHAAVPLEGRAANGSWQYRMIMFGGAGSGTLLYDDTWALELWQASAKRGPFASASTVASWCELAKRPLLPECQLEVDSDSRPSGRSSHVLTPWRNQEAVVMHGGLGNSGTMSDTWIFLQKSQEWELLRTTGPSPARAHHCGAVVKDTLWLYAGQGDTLLTASDVSSLDLLRKVWSTVRTCDGPPACIDAGAAPVADIGFMVFGGVGVDFEFVPPAPWVLIHTEGCADDSITDIPATSIQAVASSGPRLQADHGVPAASPGSRACCSICSDGLSVFVYGGFDGHKDLNELWCLNLTPPCFEGATDEQHHTLDLLPRAALGS